MNSTRYSRYVLLSTLIFTLVLLTSSNAFARGVGIVDPYRSDIHASFGGYHSSGNFEQAESASGADTKFEQQFAGIRIEKSIIPQFQLYLLAGQSRNTFSDSDVDAGSALGGGFQITFENKQDAYVMLEGSYLSHSKENFTGSTTRDYQMTSDYQAGILLGKRVNEDLAFREEDLTYHAYWGVQYSPREIEVTDGTGTKTYEPSKYEGLSGFLGFKLDYTKNVSFSLEAEGGSVLSGNGRMIYRF
ncbi:MAG: hypothetical protein ABEJ65_10615 [bacterium]